MSTFVGGDNAGCDNCIFGRNVGGGAVLEPSVIWHGAKRKEGRNVR